jgi:hypothetical protein
MPSTVNSLFAAAGLLPTEIVKWGQPPRLDAPGVYVVSLSEEAGESAEALAECPVYSTAVSAWLTARPELQLDGVRPDVDRLAARLARFWFPDEVVLYVGLAGTSVRQRVKQYYSTPLGARRPHAGGHFLKTLSSLNELWVHCAATEAPDAAEDAMLRAFVAGVSATSGNSLHDPTLPIPFANLEWPRGRRKLHGITGSKGDITPTPGSRGRFGAPGLSEARKSGTISVTATTRGAPPTLHEEIARIVRENGNRWMTTQELAGAVNRAGNYHKRDGSPVDAFQIHGRTRKYGHLFERDGSRVRLRAV